MGDTGRTYPTTHAVEQEVTLARAVREHWEILAQQTALPGVGDPREGPLARAEQVICHTEQFVQQLTPSSAIVRRSSTSIAFQAKR